MGGYPICAVPVLLDAGEDLKYLVPTNKNLRGKTVGRGRQKDGRDIKIVNGGSESGVKVKGVY